MPSLTLSIPDHHCMTAVSGRTGIASPNHNRTYKTCRSSKIGSTGQRFTSNPCRVQFEAAKMKNKMPDPRAAIPVTGLPKWVLPISAILGLSILSAVLSSTAQQTSNLGPGLASGSL
mmetsp:Transcript_23321/g.36484  ORF Transcript_23321/g.36484 Transcript_23321/m.36484 type:complete len:117 (-) Transcript_23321:159-509(-)